MDELELTPELIAKFEQARERGRIGAEIEPRAKSARYDRKTARVVVELISGATFIFPAELGQGLTGATPDDLADIEIVSGGYGLHWEKLDADLAVPSLMMGRFGSQKWMSELGRAGGRSTSARKAEAARLNGKKGGRPRLIQPQDSAGSNR